MDPGHLDRVVTGMVAQEILEACDDMGGSAEGGGAGGGGGGGDGALANPALGNFPNFSVFEIIILKSLDVRGGDVEHPSFYK